MRETDRVLTTGLVEGYADASSFPTTITREHPLGGFRGKQSARVREGEQSAYVDQWFAGLKGGGQELAQSKNDKATRLYAGGTITPEELAKLGITEDQVSAQLRKSIIELGATTRLDVDCTPEPDGDWQYSYRILKHLGEIDLTIGLESIVYKGQLVFAHGFLKSPIE